MHYLLDKDKKPYKVTVVEMVEGLKDRVSKVVQQDIVRGPFSEEVFVSTVFLGMDHSFGEDKTAPDYKPVLWETMIFGGVHDQYMERYRSYEDAVEGHKKALELIK